MSPLRVCLLLSEEAPQARLAAEVIRAEGHQDLTECPATQPQAHIVIADPRVPHIDEQLAALYPAVIIAYLPQADAAHLRQAIHWGAVGVITPNSDIAESRQVIRHAVTHYERRQDWLRRALERWAKESPWIQMLYRLPVGLILLGPTRNILWINATAAQWLNCTREGDRWACEGALPDLQELAAAAQEKGQAQREFLSPSGRTLAGYALVDDRRPVVLIHLQDVTEAKEAETRRDQLVQHLSLQLRSPLTAILGYTELLERTGSLTDIQHEFIQRIYQGVRTMTGMLEKLVELNRIEAGMDMQWEPVPLTPLLRYTAEAMQPRAAAKGVTFIAHIPEGLPAVLAPPGRLRQVFDHLVGDAIRYTPEGGKVTLTAMVAEDQIIIQVQDTGVGIPPDEIPKIFDRFYRASNVATRFAGSGLGLTLVQSIVTQLGGRIWVDSQLNQGTTFTVLLPVAAQEAA